MAGSAGLVCGIEGGNSVGVTSWEVFWQAPMPPTQNPIPDVGSVIIRVYRKNAATQICDSYTLQIAD